MTPSIPQTTDVLIVGAGPAGLMLSTLLTRLGIPLVHIDDRPHATSTGRADGLQPKTLETLSQLRLLTPLLERGVKIYDISYWNSTPGHALRRTRRECHFPGVVEVVERFILICHQGVVEGVLEGDVVARGGGVVRGGVFAGYEVEGGEGGMVRAWFEKLGAVEEGSEAGGRREVRAKYVVGCDGAHSAVRRCMPGAKMEGESTDVFWGVLDGVIETDFPDLWSKCAIATHDKGTILCIPRERGMTRLYIELSNGTKSEATQEFVMARAKEIMAPFSVEWRSVEWFGVYQIGQRIASTFSDRGRVFIAGDAAHTHSPKAAQGMNVSMHDTFNFAWKLALVLKGLSPPSLLDTYISERRKIAEDLIAFDHAHASAFTGNDAAALAANFEKNIRFISGVGADYDANVLNRPLDAGLVCGLVPGQLLIPARATRYVDANPVDLQRDIPWLGQWRVYFLTDDYHAARPLLEPLCAALEAPTHILARAAAASAHSGVLRAGWVAGDEFVQPGRYLVGGQQVVSYSLITRTARENVELEEMPAVVRAHRWAVYVDDLGEGVSPVGRWCGEGVSAGGGGGLKGGEVLVVCVRPDGYVGAVGGRWGDGQAREAAEWLEAYFSGFLVG
ncbi:FAD binding domain-containing protein [Morchella snyderi]|nr:FAD binding domain-containing protein [Morchella snyderi]